MKRRSAKYALFAVLLLATGVAVELLRVVFDWGAVGFNEAHSETISIALAVLWTATALAVVARHRQPWLASTAWVLSIASTLAMAVHAFMLRVGDVWFGGFYLLGAALLGFALWRTMGRPPEFRRLRREARHEA